MDILATCLTIAAALLTAQGGETIQLSGDCPTLKIERHYPTPVTIEASGATVRGLIVSGSNIRWHGGTLRAAGGKHAAAQAGYALQIHRSAANVTVQHALLTDAKKQIVVDQASDVAILDSLFDRGGEDGIIASRVTGLTITGNRFMRVDPKPTSCTLADGSVSFGLSSRACVALGGAWRDGGHPDAVQLRNGVIDALIADNEVEGAMQGIGQFATTGDAPLERVRIEHNRVAVNSPHAITLGDCHGCTIRWNEVARGEGSTWKTAIRFNPLVTSACGNRVADVKEGTAACAGE